MTNAQNIERKVINVKAEVHDQESVEMLKSIGTRHLFIKSLSLENGDWSKISIVLGNFSQLETLELKSVNVSLPKDNLIGQTITLPRLKSLKITDMADAIFEFIKAEKFSSLSTDLISGSVDNFLNFMANAKHLKHLKLSITNYVNIFHTQRFSQSFSFQLKSFEAFSDFLSFGPADDNLNKFLLSQTSLQNLKVRFYSPEVFSMVFLKLRQLKTLTMDARSFPREPIFYQMKPNSSMRTLHVFGNISDEKNAIGLLSKFPNLESLTFSFESSQVRDETFIFMSTNNLKLKFLSIDALTTQRVSEVEFKSELKNFYMKKIENVEILAMFLKNNPSIETFESGWFNDGVKMFSIHDAMHSLMDTKIKHLKFRAHYDEAKEIYDVVKNDYKNLKSLELIVQLEIEEDGPRFVFNFPENIAQWDPSCDFFDTMSQEVHDRIQATIAGLQVPDDDHWMYLLDGEEVGEEIDGIWE